MDWSFVGEQGFEGVRQVAIDADWSALRFRQARFIKTMKSNPKMAISEEGKKKLPSLHSPFFAPEAKGAITTGVMAMTSAALEILQ